jgi:hypothetical protein
LDPPNQESRDLLKKRESDKGFWKLILVSIGAFLAIDLNRAWAPEPYATGLAVLAIGLGFYWLPPKPSMAFGRWTIRIFLWALFFAIVRIVYDLICKHSRPA